MDFLVIWSCESISTVKLLETDQDNRRAKFSALNIDFNKCTKHQFIHLLTATFKDLHIENSKKLQKVILPASH